jgi:hypothetical protein
LTANELFQQFHTNGVLSEILGDKNTLISAVSAVDDCGPGDLVFVDKKDYIATVLEKKPSVIVTSKPLADSLNGKVSTVLVAPLVAMAHALIKEKLAARNYNDSGWEKIHPTAVIHESAIVDSTATIEPRAVVGARAKIGKNSRIMSGAVIERDAVIGENGAFAMFMREGKLARSETPGAPVEKDRRAQLTRLGETVRARFPHARWASDQPYREFDLAIDFREDVAPWPDADVRELVQLCEAEGAHAKVSSIHVNAWFGGYDKKTGFDHWLGVTAPGSGVAHARSEWLFIGDSPNDEPMFAHFPNSVGVANLSVFRDQLRTPPRWITRAESGEGFAEMAQRLIAARKA